jgi:hypothetical protein
MQTVFDAAWNEFIVNEKPPSVRYDDTTNMFDGAYRGDNGSKCAFGLVLSDDIIDGYEGCAASQLIHQHKDLFSDEKPLQHLQYRLHDGLFNYNTGEWKTSLEERRDHYLEVARIYNLTVPE